MINEANFELVSSPDSDVEKMASGDAMNERIREWLATPEGTLLGDPSWGNNLLPYKFEPLKYVEVIIEMSIARKLPLDIEDLRLVAVEVEAVDIDMLHVVITHEYGEVDETISL